MKKNSWLFALILVSFLGMKTSYIHAAEVSSKISSRETYVGMPITFQIIISNATDYDEPELPIVPNVIIRSTGTPSQSTYTSIINGVSESTTSLTYSYLIIPQKPGKYTIPPFVVRADGKEHKIKSYQFLATKSETDDMLFVELKGNRNKLYIGESLKVTLQIWLKPYINRQFSVKLNEGNMWECIEVRNCQWSIFGESLQALFNKRQRPQGREEIRKDSQGNERSYYLYEIERTIWPEKPGQLDVGNISIVVAYPTQLGRSRDIFSMGNLVIRQTRPITAQVKVDPIHVLPVPIQNRPQLYRGAVGQYQINTAAKPVEVNVGDPITLTMEITGTGRLEELQAPQLSKIEELSQNFKVPADPLAGEVEGYTKRFSQSIRATSDAVTHIPPIPFVYFDPQQETFVTVKSDPIPIKVKPTEKLAVTQITESGRATTIARRLTEIESGILANYIGMDEVLSQQEFTPHWPSAVGVAAPPILFFICWLTRFHSDRLKQNISLARQRTAKRNAIKAIHAASKADRSQQAAALSNAISGYVADRCNLPTGGLTRANVVDQLTQSKVSQETINQIDDFLQKCEDMQYAGTTAKDHKQLINNANDCLKRLQKERL